MMKWDEWRGTMDGKPVFYSKHLFNIFGWKISLHKMVGPDEPDCFHSHPAKAIRVVLWGGYIEEWPMGRTAPNRRHLSPGYIGIVRPEFVHRIDMLANGRASYSLWVRGPKTAKINLIGKGWRDLTS